MLRIAIVAGEASGDLLAAGLMRALSEQRPDAVFEGIGGPRMQALGCKGLYPMEKLSLVGLVEVLKHLPELLALRGRLVRHFKSDPPDVFIGVDAPDFNLTLERRLRRAGVPTVHYVSPSVWAWRSYRVRKIARAVDLILTLFPFEADFFETHGVPVRFVGHPLFDAIPMDSPQAPARKALDLPLDAEVVALLPGSRVSELERLSAVFLDAAAWIAERRPGIRFVVPLTSAATRGIFEKTLRATAPDLPVMLLGGHSQAVMQAADVVLMASGTAALEAMLLKRPMVVAYRLTNLTYRIMKHLVKVAVFSPPNLLAGRPLVPEFIQDAVTPENLGRAVLDFLEDPRRADAMREVFTQLHRELRRDSSRRAAEAVLSLVQNPSRRIERQSEGDSVS